MKILLYALSLLLLPLLIGPLAAQHNLPIVWKTTDGRLDTGTLAKLPIHLSEDSDLVLRRPYQRYLTLRPRNIEWVIYQQDTLLLRHTHNDQSRLMRLLYAGEVRLYRVIQPALYRDYYLVRGDRWINLDRENGEWAGYAIIKQNCRRYRPSSRVKNDFRAIHIAAQLNDCLGALDHYPLPTYQTHRHQLGLLYSPILKRRSLLDDRRTRNVSSYRYRTGEEWAVYLPYFSGQYEYRVFPKRAKISVQLGATYLQNQYAQRTSLLDYTPGWKVDESWRIRMLQIYPGFNFYSGYRRPVQLSLGVGTILALPLTARRSVRLTDGHTVPELPVEQNFRRILSFSPGFYLQGGFHFEISRKMQLALMGKAELLRYQWRYPEETVFYSYGFFYREVLGEKDALRVQARLLYAL